MGSLPTMEQVRSQLSFDLILQFHFCFVFVFQKETLLIYLYD